MSHALTNKIKYLGDLSFHEKSILFRLADESRGDKGEVSMSVSTIAAYAGCNERTVQRLVSKLVHKGVLIPTGTAGGRGHVQGYTIYLEKLPVQERRPPRKTRLIRNEEMPPESSNGHAAPPEQDRQALIESLRRQIANGQKAQTWPDGHSLKARTVERGERARQQLQELGENE